MKPIFFSLLLLLTLNLPGQNLTSSRQSGYYTYIFSISDQEANKIYKSGKTSWSKSETFFHTVADSFPVYSEFEGRLKPGHYIKVCVKQNDLEASVFSVLNVNPQIIDNTSDLIVQIYDSTGKTVSDAKVEVAGAKLRYSSGLSGFVMKRAWVHGIMKIRYQGQTSFFTLSQKYKPYILKTLEYRTILRTPLKYLWVPLKFIIAAPVITARDLTSGHSYNIGNDLDSYLRGNGLSFNSGYRYDDRNRGYLVFSKPMYLPSDTVRYKAFLVNSHGRLLKRKLDVKLAVRDKADPVVGTITPSQPGNYNGWFVLDDSLGLDLDEYQRLYLGKKSWHPLGEGSFKYEDYELRGLKLNVRTDSSTQIRGRKFLLHIKATDENGLNIQDGRLEITILPDIVRKQHAMSVFIRDTLLSEKLPLEQTGETHFQVPDSVFPEADLAYVLKIRVLRSDNEYKEYKEKIEFYHQSNDIRYELLNDSVLFLATCNGIPVNGKAVMKGTDVFGFTLLSETVDLPFKAKLNTCIKSYRISSGSVTRTFTFADAQSLVSCESDMQHDSLTLDVLNPRKLPFSWFLYRANSLVKKGYGREFSYHGKINPGKKYFLIVNYLWSGETKMQTYELTGNKNNLTIQADQPLLVYPGQKVSVTATVKDYRGRPVDRADLTALSYTGKFGSDPTSPGVFPDTRQSKRIHNRFSLSKIPGKESTTRLDYSRWKDVFTLDTIEYYKFLHHNEEIRYVSYTPPDGQTQFAPYVIKDGAPVAVYAVSIDRVPVYFGFLSDENQPYSFRTYKGYHHISIRTRDKLFEIDSVCIQDGKKLLLSINDQAKPVTFSGKEMRYPPGKEEIHTYERYLFPYRENFGENFAYLKQDNRITILKKPGEYNGYNRGISYYPGKYNHLLAGPVRPSGTTLVVPGNYEHTFEEEPGFEYDFSRKIIKMRSITSGSILPRYWYNPAVLRFADLPLSEKTIEDACNEYNFKRKLDSARFNLAHNTLPADGRICLFSDSLSLPQGQKPIFLILRSCQVPVRETVYPGSARYMEAIRPGSWTLFLYFRGGGWFSYDSIQVSAGGTTYLRPGRPGPLLKDELSDELARLIDRQVYNQANTLSDEMTEYSRQVLRQQLLKKYSGTGVLISGIVTSEEGPVPGATVLVKGTDIGTVTDMEGNYSLLVPYENRDLVISFIGYNQAEVHASGEIVNVNLEASVNALQEVVVTAMGISSKYALTSAMSGRVAGVSVESPLKTIMIRGAGSIDAASAPLIVIDGVPFNGDLSLLDPSMLTNIQVVRDESLTSLYGSGAANGVVLISTAGLKITNPKLLAMLKGADYDSAFASNAEAAGSVRKNFRDYACWKPDLITDKQGKVSFEFTYPDDITSWSAYLIAMTGKKQSGFNKATVKSYKPLVAQLQTPRFMIEGDSVNMIGKIQNYASDSVLADISFEVNDSTRFTYGFRNNRSSSCTLPVIAQPGDSLKIRYFFRRNDGYVDGEERKIPVFRKGLEMTRGTFLTLNSDTTVTLSNISGPGPGKIYASTDVLEVMDDEINQIINYYYECNEQLASKLYALLARETICKFRDKQFHNKLQVNRIIRSLSGNQNADGCWGWWDRSETSEWVTLHVLGALQKAKEKGYRVELKTQALSDYFIWRMESELAPEKRLDMLFIMSASGTRADYSKYLDKLSESDFSEPYNKFRLMELKQRLGKEFSTDTVLKYSRYTMFGNLYFEGGEDKWNYCRPDVLTTLTAYRIFRNCVPADKRRMTLIRNYLLELRNSGSWQNTFESASVIETILSDMKESSEKKIIRPQLQLSGSVSKNITEFPFEMTTHPGDSVTISKTGGYPVYLTSYQHYWKSDPSTDSSCFELSTSFRQVSGALTAGTPVVMDVRFRVFKFARYVMLEIPVPAGCSYDSKGGYFRNAEHTEFFRDHVSVFFSSLLPGSYEYEISLLPRYTGRFTLNPAKAELMYFPVFSSNNAMKTIDIK